MTVRSNHRTVCDFRYPDHCICFDPVLEKGQWDGATQNYISAHYGLGHLVQLLFGRLILHSHLLYPDLVPSYQRGLGNGVWN